MIPDFQTIMLPLLKAFQNGKEKTSKELREEMVSHFNISEDEQKEKIPSGKQPLYYNRVAWAIAYLKMADLISSPARAVVNGKYNSYPCESTFPRLLVNKIPNL